MHLLVKVICSSHTRGHLSLQERAHVTAVQLRIYKVMYVRRSLSAEAL